MSYTRALLCLSHPNGLSQDVTQSVARSQEKDDAASFAGFFDQPDSPGCSDDESSSSDITPLNLAERLAEEKEKLLSKLSREVLNDLDSLDESKLLAVKRQQTFFQATLHIFQDMCKNVTTDEQWVETRRNLMIAQ